MALHFLIIDLTFLFNFICIQLHNLKSKTEMLGEEESSFLLFTLNYVTRLKINVKPVLAY